VVHYKNKIVLILLLYAFASPAVTFCAPNAPNLPDNSTAQNSKSLFTNDANFPFKKPTSFENNELLNKFIFSILLVIALGAIAFYLSKKFGSKITKLSGKKIKIIETIYLGQRKTLHLVKIKNREILIGSTNENISMLADVTDDSVNLYEKENEND